MKRMQHVFSDEKKDSMILPSVILSAAIMAIIIVHMDMIFGVIQSHVVFNLFPCEQIQSDARNNYCEEKLAYMSEFVPREGELVQHQLICYRRC